MAAAVIVDKRKQNLARYFKVAKIILCLTPLIGYLYITLYASKLGISQKQLLVDYPSYTIIFLIAMMNPYIAYIVHLVEKKLEEGQYDFACVNMSLLLLAQMLTMNVFYFLLILIVFYKAAAYYQLNILKELKTITIKKFFFYGGGSVMTVLVSLLCLFSTIRIR